jgi:tRNA uridine 5-carbamoylmethylation protein Kti12
MEQIYALYYEYANQRKYFYVGRTERDPKIRLREHRSKVRKGTEDVYRFIRERCQPNGIDVWEMELLVNDQGDPTEDCEDFWVVLMIRAGHDLKNMKHGDLRKIAQLRGLAQAQGDFTTVKEFVRFREDYERSERLKREVLEQQASPRDDIQSILAQAKLNFQEKESANMQRRRAKEARERANALERTEWLKKQRGLFGE